MTKTAGRIPFLLYVLTFFFFRSGQSHSLIRYSTTSAHTASKCANGQLVSKAMAPHAINKKIHLDRNP